MYKIKIYKIAQQDLREIVGYINTLSQQSAMKYYELLIDKISSLAKMPERCALLKDTGLHLRGYRALIVEKYIIFYVIKGDTVQIRRILYGRRQYDWML